MTIKTKDEMTTQINTLLADNASGDISASDLRTVTQDIFDSARWRSFTTLAVDTTLDQGDHNGIIADDSLSNLEFTLPDSAANSGATFGVLKASNSTNAVTITPAGTDTINGESSIELNHFGEIVSIISNGTGEWWISSSNQSHFYNIELNTDIAELPPYLAGQISYDPGNKTITADTGITGVRVQIGQELQYLVYNNSGSQIDNGKPVFASGVNTTYNLLEIELANASSFFTSAQTLGFATSDIPNGTVGLVTEKGQVKEIDTSALNEGGVVYLDITAGDVTNTKPTHPNQAILLGSCIKSDATEGIIQVAVSNLTKPISVKSYSYTSRDTLTGYNYVAGFYDAPSADANLDEGSTTVVYGDTGNPYNAHAFIVPSAAGVVAGGGQVGLRVNGDSFSSSTGVLTTSDSDIITDDITSLTGNTYFETPKKFCGDITFELYVVSGTPTAYSLDFNYGYAKYEDFNNTDFTLESIEVVGMGRDGDNGFNIEMMHHKTTGWTYATNGFVPGNGDIANWEDDLGTYAQVNEDEPFAWKRTALETLVEGSGSEGVLFRITTTSNRAVLRMDMHLAGYLED